MGVLSLFKYCIYISIYTIVLSNATPTLYEYYTGDLIRTGLSVNKPYFQLNGKNISIYSGGMHYFRIPRKHWRDRLRKLRASGLNTVETYVPWNLHEPQNGVFDFGDGGSDFEDMLDIKAFLTIAKEEDLFVLLRPGPYICAEFEWGGLPSWLLREEGIAVRTSDPKFIGHVTRYFNRLLPLLATSQFLYGGPIIGFQIENEYGYFGNDYDYLRQLLDMYENYYIDELKFTSDGAGSGTSGSIPDWLFLTINAGGDPTGALDKLRQFQPGKPVMIMEHYPGWFDHWTETHHTVSTADFQQHYEAILKYPASANLYMFHGGTNFAFLNGANMDTYFKPTTTSYDYDAPLSEAGDYTEKYEVLRQLLLGQYNLGLYSTPDPPALVPRVAYPSVQITETLLFQDILDQAAYKLSSPDVIPMELLDINNGSGQSYGYIVYEVNDINIPANANLTITGYVHDSVLVLLNDELVEPPLKSSSDLDKFGYWRTENSMITLTEKDLQGATLQLVVANWGRVNFGKSINGQFKGLLEDVLINDDVLSKWKITPLEFKTKWNQNLSRWTTGFVGQNGPALYKGTWEIENENPADTYVNMQNWNEGIVIVNGFVIGRYTMIGPQQTLYLPGPWLKQGKNEIIVFDHFSAPVQEIEFSKDPILNINN